MGGALALGTTGVSAAQMTGPSSANGMVVLGMGPALSPG